MPGNGLLALGVWNQPGSQKLTSGTLNPFQPGFKFNLGILICQLIENVLATTVFVLFGGTCADLFKFFLDQSLSGIQPLATLTGRKLPEVYYPGSQRIDTQRSGAGNRRAHPVSERIAPRLCHRKESNPPICFLTSLGGNHFPALKSFCHWVNRSGGVAEFRQLGFSETRPNKVRSARLILEHMTYGNGFQVSY